MVAGQRALRIRTGPTSDLDSKYALIYIALLDKLEYMRAKIRCSMKLEYRQGALVDRTGYMLLPPRYPS
jgi:hypothetical protein